MSSIREAKAHNREEPLRVFPNGFSKEDSLELILRTFKGNDMKTFAQQYRECQAEVANDFVKEFAIAEGWKYFHKIGWYCHTIIFLDGSTFVLSNGSSADGYLEHFTEAPEIS